MAEELRRLIESEVEPIVNGLGFRLVELRHGQSRKQNHVSITVYRPEGVSVDDCATISRMLYPRLELRSSRSDEERGTLGRRYHSGYARRPLANVAQGFHHPGDCARRHTEGETR
jgi:hypothetical protein